MCYKDQRSVILKVIERVRGAAVVNNFKVKVRARRIACRAHVGDRLAGGDGITHRARKGAGML